MAPSGSYVRLPYALPWLVSQPHYGTVLINVMIDSLVAHAISRQLNSFGQNMQLKQHFSNALPCLPCYCTIKRFIVRQGTTNRN